MAYASKKESVIGQGPGGGTPQPIHLVIRANYATSETKQIHSNSVQFKMSLKTAFEEQLTP